MIKNLVEFQEKNKSGFDSIAVDITGFCNAKCKYCPAGNDLTNNGKFISLDNYEKILQRLIEYKFYTKLTNFHIYCLGEPCLHPNLNEILKLTDKYNIRTTISTNASIVPTLDNDGLKCVDRILISMPGFSQESYDKIHGFNFEKIISNILQFKEMTDEMVGYGRIPFDMSYHMYQFNGHEINKAYEFCRRHDMRFSPNYAVLIDKNKCLSYVNNTMDYGELKDISKELFLGVLDHQIEIAPRDYCDFQENFLSINVDGDVRICSSFKLDYEKNILCGNILNDDIDKIIKMKYSHPRCEICIKAGLTLAKGYDCKVFPDYWYSVIKENQLLKDEITCNNSEAIEQVEINLELLHQIRYWEEKHYCKNEGVKALELLKKYGIKELQLKEIIEKYSRFGIKTYEKFIDLSRVSEEE